MFRKYFLMAFLSLFCSSLFAKAMIDNDVLELVRTSNKTHLFKNAKPEFLSLLVFFNNPSDKDKLIAKIRELGLSLLLTKYNISICHSHTDGVEDGS